MKILLIQPCYENYGGYFRSFAMARYLAKKGNQVDLLISSKDNSWIIEKKVAAPGLTVYVLPRINFHPFLNGKIARGLIGCLFISFRQYDVIHIFESVQFETNIPLIFSKLIRKKVILDIDEEWLENFAIQGNQLLASYVRWCDLKLATSFDNLTVTSRYLVNKYHRLGVKNVVKIINGVDHNQFKPVSRQIARRELNISQNERMILSFGNTYEGDRAYLLLKTYQEIWKKNKNYKLYVNFDPFYYLKDRKVKREMDGTCLKQIISTGYISFDKLPLYLGACDLVMFPMGHYNSEKACFPIRIGTYLNGERIVAMNRTDTEAYLTLAEENCVVTGARPDDLAENILSVLRHSEKQQNLEHNVRLAKKHLSWERITDDLIELYCHVYDLNYETKTEK